MKQSIFTKMIFGAIMALSLGMTACAKKDGSSVRVAARGGAVNANSAPSDAASCNNSVAGTGQLNASSNAVLALVSATISPQSFGTICRTNFSAALKFDSSGNIVSSGSTVFIQIVDSWVGQATTEGKTIKPYEIQFSNASSGVYNRSSGGFQAVFTDEYGSFAITGTVSGATATGTVLFNNKVAVSGYSPVPGDNSWATLGTFSIPTSALMK